MNGFSTFVIVDTLREEGGASNEITESAENGRYEKYDTVYCPRGSVGRPYWLRAPQNEREKGRSNNE